MQIWYECINFIKRWKQRKSLNCIRVRIINGYKYTWQDIDFGKAGVLSSPDDNIIIKFNYTYRDGIYVQIKRKAPYRIIFEYFDGAYYFNMDQGKQENRLTMGNLGKLKEYLDMLRSEGNPQNDAFTKLECIIFGLISMPHMENEME